MPTLDQNYTAHSSGSSTSVSVEGAQATTPPPELPQTPCLSSSDLTQHAPDVEEHKQVLSHEAPTVSELEGERIGRENAVSVASSGVEVAGSSLERAFVDEAAGGPLETDPVEKEKEEPFLVVWDEGEKANPKTWSKSYRWFLTFITLFFVFSCSSASSAPSGVVSPISKEFGLSQIDSTLSISLFVAGYCVGPLAWGPLSELYGRRPMFIIGFSFYTIFQVACAEAPNGEALLAFRFLSGCFAACPLTNSGAILADIWDNEDRGTAMAFYVISPFAGLALGLINGGFVAVRGTSWRWVFWLQAMLSGLCFFLTVIAVPETYAPVLLVKKARIVREETGDERFTAALEREARENTDWRVRLRVVLGRPFKILFLEPLLMVLTLYTAYVYGILFLLFTAYPVIFIEGHGFNAGQNALAFLPVFIGSICGAILYVFWFAPQYQKECEKCAPFPPPTEIRLPMSLYGGPIFMIGIFWLGWTSYPSFSFWLPLMAGFPIGVSMVLLFLSLLNYMVDAYLVVAASVLAANSVVRNMFGAAFPLFGNQMYTALNPQIASTVLGAAAFLLVPAPFFLIRWGPTLRKKSRYAMDPMHETNTHCPGADNRAPKDIEKGERIIDI